MKETLSRISEKQETTQAPEFVLFSAEADTWEGVESDLSNGLQDFFESYKIGGNINNETLQNVFASQIIHDLPQRLDQNYTNIGPLIVQGFRVQNGYLIVQDTMGKEYLYAFDVHAKTHFIPNPLSEVLSEKRELIRKPKEDFSQTLDVLEYLFEQNENEWFGFMNEDDDLNAEDIIAKNDANIPKELHGKNIIEIQALARQQFRAMTFARHSIVGKDSEIDAELYPLEKRYMTMIMGVGDKYEGGARAFAKDNLEIKYLVARQVEARPRIENLLAFLKEEHLKIDSNNWQSDTVQESYQFYTQELHSAILERLKIELDAAGDSAYLKDKIEKQAVEFIKIITGRSTEIDRELTDSYTANKAIMMLFSRKGGIMDTFASSPELGEIQVEDEEYIGKKTPQEIVIECEKLLSNIMDDENVVKIMKELGVWDFKENKALYDELSFQDKGKISLIARLNEKLKPQHRNLGRGGRRVIPSKIKNYSDLVGAIGEIEKEVSWNTVAEVSSKFDGTLSNWDGLDRKELEGYNDSNGNPLFNKNTLDLIDMFHEMNGNGWLEFSDTSNYVTGEIGKMIPIIVGGIIIGTIAVAALPVTIGAGAIVIGGTYAGGHAIGTVVAGSIITQTALVGAGASITSWATHPKGYDSLQEAGTDLGSDIVIGTITGAAGGKIAQQFGIQGARLLSMDQLRNLKVNIPDIAVLGLGAEAFRGGIVSQMFHEQIIQEGKTRFGESPLLPESKEFEQENKPENGDGDTPLVISQNS